MRRRAFNRAVSRCSWGVSVWGLSPRAAPPGLGRNAAVSFCPSNFPRGPSENLWERAIFFLLVGMRIFRRARARCQRQKGRRGLFPPRVPGSKKRFWLVRFGGPNFQSGTPGANGAPAALETIEGRGFV